MSYYPAPALSFVLVLALASLCALSLASGAVFIPPARIVSALLFEDGPASLIIRELRLPRTLLALEIGFFSGLAGAVLQGLLRNPLADVGVFGAPQMAALGAVLVMYFGFAGALSFTVLFAAILGALASIGLVVAAAGRRANSLLLVLAGLAVGSLAGAGTSLALSLSPNPFAVTEIVFWMMGSLEDRSMVHVMLATPFLATASLMLLPTGSALRALTLGEEVAASLGFRVDTVRALIVAGCAVGTGAAVAAAGSIGFIGLIAPHLVRSLIGSDPGRILLPSALLGACLLLAADCAIRVIPTPTEVRIGVVTALLGVPVFLVVLAKRRGEWSGEA